MSADAPFFTSLRDRAPERLRDDGEALVEVAEARPLPRRARRLDARRRRLAAADDRAAPAAARRSTSTRLPRPAGVAARALAADVPELRLPARRAAPEHADAACDGVHAPRAGLRAVRRVRRHRACCGSPPAARQADVWDLAARAAHRVRGRAERDRHRLVLDAVVGAAPAVARPAEALEEARRWAAGSCATIRVAAALARRARPRSARARRRASRARYAGSTASRSPFHRPVASSGYSRTVPPTTSPSATPTACSVSPARRRARRGRRPPNSACSSTNTRAADGEVRARARPAPAASRQRRALAARSATGELAAATPLLLLEQRAPTPTAPSTPGSARSPPAASRWSSPCSASIAETAR